ncbi:NADH:flavin oxidoreductase [Bradyrhizobium sp. AUGA SZCCT0240]|uniref:NADH:flavin oxidoreductase n=1 Tax=unclassified Bradyrhizobium TaxID=2631580 RepID=UPI001BAAE7F9|nr:MULTISPECIES: NADH:flavin oxidoreductase [unclassified Bradyrhizobium]MBR1195929.1 NADH:flavin oxidoreductase [Bradyrhizobium sp. AUGA SZCCT0158]MBR1240766.1 NADH:flavin oxidoreductase [Bradyrhizobium sp. AUGA SZCCT0274]MBR1252210.1 NADH:flavin oxidoreductase [Bradyrhizobium sp. AUGA SZCCT0240]
MASDEVGSRGLEQSAIERLFVPLQVGSLTLANRLAVAPMTRVSADQRGRATRSMADYYRWFAEGGFGMIVTEGIYTDKAFSQGYLYQPGLTDAAQVDAWRTVVDGVHQAGGRIIAQLMHAGALSQGNPYRSQTAGPSAIRPKGEQLAFYRGCGAYPMPVAMTEAEIAEAVEGFARAALFAKDAGFDGVEVHGANGYLLDQFLTEHVNLRADKYGGDIARRIQLTVEVVRAVRSAVGGKFVVSVRISQGKVNNVLHKWSGHEDDAAIIFTTLGRLPLDYLHTTEFEAWRPAFGETGASLSALAKRHARLPVLANGSLHDPKRAAALLANGEADFVSLGRGALAHADWPVRARAANPMAEFDRALLSPIADLANAERWRTARQEQDVPNGDLASGEAA